MEISNTHAYEDLVDEYGESLYRFCRRLAYSKEDAEDLLQETFLTALEQLPKALENPRGFLFSTALYLWKSMKRKFARRRRIAPVAPLDDNIADDASVEDGVIAQEESRLIRRLVSALPDRYKIPLVLYYSVEMGQADIADMLGIPVGTVKSRLHKGRRLVEKGLVKYGC